MKKILLVATVLAGGMAFSRAGVNVSIGFGIPLPPLPGVVIRQPAYCPPVYVAPRYYPPRVVVPCPPVRYQPVCGPSHRHGRGYDCHRYDRGHHDNRHGNGHRR